jgi:hypothetical protein
MAIEEAELDVIQATYKSAVEEWIVAIRHEEALASTAQNIADVDKWEEAADLEEKARDKAKAAKEAYESALREKFFNF